MNLSQLTQFVSNLSQQFQQTLSLAKRIEELPVQESLLPTSKIHVSRGGVSQSLEIQKIIDAASSLDYNRIISIGAIQRNGNEFIVPANATWKISGVEGTNISPFEFELLPENAGNKRIDLLIVRLSGFEVITGTSSSNISFAPDIPNPSNAILVKEYKIDGDSIDEGSAPISGNPYILKNQFNQIAASEDKKFYLQQQSNYLIIDPAIMEIKGIYLNENGEAESYTGKLGFFTNFLDVAVLMRHLDAEAPIKFKFPKTNGDYSIQPGETLYFIEESYGVADSNLWKCLNEKATSVVNPASLLSANANNAAVLGTDEKIFVPKSAQTFAQSTWSFTDLYSGASPQGSFYVLGLAGGVLESIQSYGTDGSGVLVKTGTGANSGGQVSTGMGVSLKQGATIYAEAYKRGTSVLEVGGFYNWPFEMKIKVNESNQIQAICTNGGLTSASAFGEILIENDKSYGFLIEKLTATTASFKVYNSQKVLIFNQVMNSNVPGDNALLICATRLYRPLAGANGVDIGALEYYGMGRAKPNFLNF